MGFFKRVPLTGPILVGCEESQVVTKAFRDAGFEAYSCDLQPTRGNPEWHYQQDIVTVLTSRRWGMIILHPDCTAMAVSGNRWYGRGTEGYRARREAIAWTLTLWSEAKRHSSRVALENPVSVIFNYIQNVHYIQPWQFGHGEVKKTGFALWGLPPLKPTNIVKGREQRVWKMAPGEHRKRDRSETFAGVADAMVKQWGISL